jgi:hypothetical protein
MQISVRVAGVFEVGDGGFAGFGGADPFELMGFALDAGDGFGWALVIFVQRGGQQHGALGVNAGHDFAFGPFEEDAAFGRTISGPTRTLERREGSSSLFRCAELIVLFEQPFQSVC